VILTKPLTGGANIADLTRTTPLRLNPTQLSLAARLAGACVNPSYVADLWAIYFARFEEVLAAEMAMNL
jgi:hypothetical protein